MYVVGSRRATHSLDRTEAAKLALQILLVSVVVKARHDQRLEGIATDVRIFLRFICPEYDASVKPETRQINAGCG
jgi:hypothetical protein